MSDATGELRQGIDSNDEVLAMLVTITSAVGIISGYFQVLGVSGLFDYLLPHSVANSDAPALAKLSQQLDDLLQLAAANAADVKMTALNGYAISVDSALVLLAANGAKAVDPTSAITFQKDAIEFLQAARDPLYWTRPFLEKLTFLPEMIDDRSAPSGELELSWGWYGDLPQPSAQADIYPMVLDSRLALPYFLKAVETFLSINALLNPNGFSQLIDQYNKTPNDLLPSIAEKLKELYSTLVTGIVKSDVPSPNDIGSYLAIWEKVPNIGPLEPTCAANDSHAIYDQNGLRTVPLPTATMDKTGCSWNGVYGVVDTYGIYDTPVSIPSRDVSHMVERFPADHIGELPHDHPYLPGYTPYRWVRDRVSLGLMARWKAIYMLRGYNLAWSTLQDLRVILRQQQDDRLTLPDGTIASEHWSARELISVLQLKPLYQSISPDYVEEPWFSVYHLVQRLDLISRGTWVTPLDDDFFDFGERLNHTTVTKRPVSFRDRLAAAAV